MSTSAIRCRSLVKRYGKQTAVDGIELDIARGECFGLLGPNGAGKTTTVEMLEGLNRPDSGTVELFGIAWGSGRDQELRERIGGALSEVASKRTGNALPDFHLCAALRQRGLDYRRLL